MSKTLLNSDIASVTQDLAEVSLDMILNDGILKDIPVISTIVGVGKTMATVRDQLFLKKIIYFISSINDIPQKERLEAIDRIDSSDEYRVKVGEKLLYILDRCEDHKTAEVIAILFGAFLKKEISYSDFLRSSSIVNNIFLDDLRNYVNKEQDYHFKIEDIGDLLNSGLYEIRMDPTEVSVEDQDDYKPESKYKARVDGGTLEANISGIGTIIKYTLRGKI